MRQQTLQKIKLKNKQIDHSGYNKKKKLCPSFSNKLNSVKNNRGLSTLAHNIVFERFTRKNNTLEKKMDQGKLYERIAIFKYE